MEPMLSPLPQAADLYGDIERTPATRWRDYLPGLAVAVLATLAALGESRETVKFRGIRVPEDQRRPAAPRSAAAREME